MSKEVKNVESCQQQKQTKPVSGKDPQVRMELFNTCCYWVGKIFSNYLMDSVVLQLMLHASTILLNKVNVAGL